ncbi:unnamed protein product [Parascedosporium putredinis]|uniref:Uncharacterized protein n=1 Tax=Parascedosporium putredinis TaxID=1442378 RepID=A0A9P1GWC8_9PEZI|nr:unnamed protein product [Parascedosporium putredinis]CAI7988723.1 unnamed protein product [Parascedosporium putredinis]
MYSPSKHWPFVLPLSRAQCLTARPTPSEEFRGEASQLLAFQHTPGPGAVVPHLHPRPIPANFSVRTHLPTPFASESSPGSESWFLLDELVPDQRYEVRVCWAATQPTAFTLSTHTVASILEDAELVVALSHYAASRASDTDSGSGPDVDALRTPPSRLLLRVVAAADYFTDDAALMKNPEPVHIDVILDPFLYNVLPRSLIPTIGYIAALVPVAWFVARRVSGGLQQVARGEDGAAAGAKKRQ